MTIKKGIILAGGHGSRLYPLTQATNKQLMPIYDKPVIYYSLTTLMLTGIREILIISSREGLPSLKKLLGSGEKIGLNITYQAQEQPNGLPEAFILGEKFIANEPVAMILGDNFFHGHNLPNLLKSTSEILNGAHIFIHGVNEPERYGIATIKDEKITSITEKPQSPKSNFAVTGLYYFDGTVAARAKMLKPSWRNELEIVDLINSYLSENRLSYTQLGRGYVWFDTGTPKALLNAANYVDVIQARQGIAIASPEEVALYMNFISQSELEETVASYPKCEYSKYFQKLTNENKNAEFLEDFSFRVETV